VTQVTERVTSHGYDTRAQNSELLPGMWGPHACLRAVHAVICHPGGETQVTSPKAI
jgi:hypothetical protein